MRNVLAAILSVLVLWTEPISAQSPSVTPMRATAGTILTFYSQSRLIPAATNPLDTLPKGTVLRVKLLDAIDSSADLDGSAFHGILISPLVDRKKSIFVPENTEVRGMLVLLRNGSHPEGFRYELLLTSLILDGKVLDLTASLNPSIFDSNKPASPEKNVPESSVIAPGSLRPPTSSNKLNN
jgi:hypothetical protein